MEWYYANEGNRIGPVTAEAFEAAIKDAKVKPETLVWTNGFEAWQPWSAVADQTAACGASGGRFLRRDMVPYEGGFIASEHKEAYFQRMREGVVQPTGMEYGGFWVRFVAKFVDGLVNWVIGQGANLLLAFAFFGAFLFQPKVSQQGVDAGRLIAFQALAFIVGIAIGLSYYYFFVSRYQATPGKMALGLKIVRADGSRLTRGRIIGRYFAEMVSSMVLGIGYIMAAFDDEKRTLHDRICDTRVVRSR